MSRTAEDLIRRHRYTVDDYYRMVEVGILTPDARVELIDGEVIEMPPIGAPHASVVTDLQNLLVEAVGKSAIVRVQNPVHLNHFNEPEPDIALVRPPARKYREAHPKPADVMLLIEVADTSLRFDRDVKIRTYARGGVPEVWLLDLNASRIIRFREPNEEDYTISELIADLTRIPLPGLKSVTVDVSGLF